MADRILSGMAGLWASRKSAKYIQMESQGQEGLSAVGEASRGQSIETGEYAQWSNTPIEEDFQDQHDRHFVRPSRVDTAEIFFPHQIAGRHSPSSSVRLKRMFTRFPIRDLSWALAIVFTIGSAVFVANSFFLLLPILDPTTDFGPEGPYLTPASSVLGTLIFLCGSWLAVLEALNLRKGVNVHVNVVEGSEVEMALSTEFIKPVFTENQPLSPHHRHTHASSQSSTVSIEPPESLSSGTTDQPQSAPVLIGSPSFICLPTSYQLTTTYAHDLYFFASIIQLVGAVIFPLATITSLPGVIDFSNTTLVALTNYLPAAIGGLLFLVSAMLQMMNVQERWWKPRPDIIEWHIGGWNAIGSAGFLLAGSLPWLGWDFEASLANFWGSWAFLAGSVLQWYCAMESYV